MFGSMLDAVGEYRTNL